MKPGVLRLIFLAVLVIAGIGSWHLGAWRAENDKSNDGTPVLKSGPAQSSEATAGGGPQSLLPNNTAETADNGKASPPVTPVPLFTKHPNSGELVLSADTRVLAYYRGDLVSPEGQFNLQFLEMIGVEPEDRKRVTDAVDRIADEMVAALKPEIRREDFEGFTIVSIPALAGNDFESRLKRELNQILGPQTAQLLFNEPKGYSYSLVKEKLYNFATEGRVFRVESDDTGRVNIVKGTWDGAEFQSDGTVFSGSATAVPHWLKSLDL